MYRQKIVRSCSKPATLMNWQTVTGERPEWAPLALSKSCSQMPGDHWKRSNCWKLPWKALGNACSIYLARWVPVQVPANTRAWSKGKSLFCWLSLIKKDQKWGDLNWFLSVAFLFSAVQCPLQHCQDLRMWRHKADFKSEEQNKLLGLGRWKRTLPFSAVQQARSRV